MLQRTVLLLYIFLVSLSFPFFFTKIQRATFCKRLSHITTGGSFFFQTIELSHRGVFGIRSLASPLVTGWGVVPSYM